MELRSISATAITLAILLGVGGCGDDTSDEPDEPTLLGDCAVISDACHEADEGEGAAHACHELAHENDQSACTAGKAACIATCMHD